MIEDTITEYLASACTLTLASDIWSGALPIDQDEGVCVSLLRDTKTRSYGIGEANIAIYVVKPSYYACRVLANSIVDAINDQKGYDGWIAIGDGASASYKGVNAVNYHLFTIYATLRKE